MKKKFAILLFVTVLFSCSDTLENIDTIDPASIDKELIKINTKFYDNQGNIESTTESLLESGKLISSRGHDISTNLQNKFVWEYNSDGLCNAIKFFDNNNAPVLEREILIEYDQQNRVSRISEWNRVRNFTYNANNTISQATTFIDSQITFNTTYFLNNNGQINKYIFDNNTSTRTVEFSYVNDRITNAVIEYGGSNSVDVNYEYNDGILPKGYSLKNIMNNMFGNTNNVIFTTLRSMESEIPLYNDEFYTSKIEYFNGQSNSILKNDFMYSVDSEGYTSQYKLHSNGVLHSSAEFTYED